MLIKILVFMIKAFQFSKFHENEVKKLNFKRGLTVTFKAKINKITEQIGLKFLKLLFYVCK